MSKKETENPTNTPQFRALMRAYDDKNYKKALKAANDILSSNPAHAEAWAMKGLIVSVTTKGQQSEAENLVRTGLKHSITSSTCWHVLGLLKRAQNQYEEAAQCFARALNRDQENSLILRDLLGVQVQSRDMAAYSKHCFIALQAKPKARQNWITYAVSLCLVGSYKLCLKVLQNYQETLEDDMKRDYETSEMFLFENDVMEKSQDFSVQEILKHLDDNEKYICDRIGFIERRLRVLLSQETLSETDKSKALEHATALLTHNPSCHQYITWYTNIATNDKSESALLQCYAELADKFPRSLAIKRLALDTATGANFKNLLAKYVSHFIAKKIPSLHSDIKGLYGDNEKVKIIGEVLADELAKASPSARLWCLLALTYHNSKTRNWTKALDQIEEAIALQDSADWSEDKVLELHIAKARVLKHMGRFSLAAAAVEVARNAEQSDRWFNSKATLYQLRCNAHTQAQKLIDRFAVLRDEKILKSNLTEMQCIWWAHESTKCFLRRGEVGPALHYSNNILKFFADYVEDQMDFHAYCMRKMTLRAYLDLLAFEDRIYSHPLFIQPAFAGCQAYLALVEPQQQGQQGKTSATNTDADNSADKKKGNKKRKDTKGKGGDTPSPQTHEDISGASLLTHPDPLKFASESFLQKLNEFGSDYLMTHVLSFKIYAKRKLLLLVLRAVKRGLKLLSQNSTASTKVPVNARAQMLVCIAHFQALYEEHKASLAPHVTAVIEHELKGDLSNDKVQAAVKLELERFPNSITHQVAELLISGDSSTSTAAADDGGKKKKNNNTKGSKQGADSWVSSEKCKVAVGASDVRDCKLACDMILKLGDSSSANTLKDQLLEVCKAVWEGAEFDLM